MSIEKLQQEIMRLTRQLNSIEQRVILLYFKFLINCYWEWISVKRRNYADRVKTQPTTFNSFSSCCSFYGSPRQYRMLSRRSNTWGLKTKWSSVCWLMIPSPLTSQKEMKRTIELYETIFAGWLKSLKHARRDLFKLRMGSLASCTWSYWAVLQCIM